MGGFLSRLFDPSGFPARWNCGAAWTEEPWLGWLHIGADLGTFLAYFAVPCVVVYFVARGRNVRLPRIFYVFLGLIFLSCGTVHLIESAIFWWPVYRILGVVKFLTAVVSCAGVVLLVRVLPRALELKTPEQLEHEVTARRRAQESLETERNLLYTLMNHLPDAIYFKDKEGKFLRISNAHAAKFQLENADQAIGKTDADFFTDEHADQARRDEEQIIATGEPLLGMVEQETWPDGRTTWVSTNKAPLRDRSGRLIGTFGISHDVTGIKQVERALRASEERFELAVRGSTDGLWDWNVPTMEVFYSVRFKELLGYKEDEFPNVFASFESHLHPDDRNATFDAIECHLKQRIPYDVEYRLRTKSGEYRWFRARGQAVWDEDGQATRMAGSITDITLRKRAEQRLAEIAAKLALPRELPAHPRPQINFEAFSLKDMISCGEDLRAMSATHGSRADYANALVRYLHDRMRDAHGEPAFALVRMYETRTFASLDEDQRHVVESQDSSQLTPDTTCLTLIATAGDQPDWNAAAQSRVHRVVPWSSPEAAARMPLIAQLAEQLGLAVGEPLRPVSPTSVGRTQSGVIHIPQANGSPHVVAQDEFVKQSGIKSVIGFGDVLPSGRFFAVIAFSKVPISQATAALFSHLSLSTKLALLAYEEVDSRVEAQILTVDRLLSNYEEVVCDQESRLRQTMLDLSKACDVAEAANRAKSDFLANMSHEIRTPMNAIIGMTELVLETPLSASQRDYLATVLESGESLLSIINEILDFSKIEAGRVELEQAPFSLREELGDTMKSLALRAHRKQLELAWHVAPDVPDSLIGDAARIRQVIVNLVGNAIKFTQQGEVVLDVRCNSATEESAELQFEVRDTGIGISQDKLSAVFEAFTQADCSTTREFGGTGLGLSISSNLVRLMGGAIHVESKMGNGSKFRFAIQFAINPETEARKQPAQLPAISDICAVIVDDNETNRRILQELLACWDIRTTAVAGGDEALAALHELKAAGQAADVVLTDVHMPKMDGFMLAERIRESDEFAETAIIILTSGGRTGDSARCEQLGISAHLLKPVKQSELFDAITAAVAPSLAVRPAKEEVGTETATNVPPLRILLAEDGLANQKLAVGLLTRWGHQVVIAANGREAVERYSTEPFDLVLMDVQMPIMDGFEATSAIRERERQTTVHVPIVAMTAHALKGDRERCLDAGMDGYVSKPIRKHELLEAIAPFFTCEISQAASEPIAESTWDVVLNTLDGDRDLFRVVLQTTLDECPRLIKELETAIAEGNCEVAQRAAHTIKSTANLLEQADFVALLQEMERNCKAKDLDDAPRQYTQVCEHWDRLRQDIESALRDADSS